MRIRLRRVLATPRLAAVADGGGRRAVRGARRGAPGADGAALGRDGHRGPALPAARRPGQAEGHRAGGDRLPEPAGAARAAAAAPPPARPGHRPAAPRGRAGDRLRRAVHRAHQPADDNALFDAVRRAGNVVLATSEVLEDGGTDVLGGPANQRAARAGGGQRGAVEGRLGPGDPPLRACPPTGWKAWRWWPPGSWTGARRHARPFRPDGAWIDTRAPGHDRHRALLRPAGRPRAGRAPAREDGGGGRDRSERQGRVRLAGLGGRGHARRRGPGARAGHDPARLPAARAAGGRGCGVRGLCSAWRCRWRHAGAAVAVAGARGGGGAGGDRLPGVPGRADRAGGGAAGRAGGGHAGHAGRGPGHGFPRTRAHARGVRPLRARTDRGRCDRAHRRRLPPDRRPAGGHCVVLRIAATSLASRWTRSG